MGPEIPVVRENAFRTSTFHLLNVPADARFRLALCVFEMNLDRARFIVRVFDQAANNFLSVSFLITSTPPQGAQRFIPGFAELDDFATSSGATAQPLNVRVEVEPLTAGSAFWGYVALRTMNRSRSPSLRRNDKVD